MKYVDSYNRYVAGLQNNKEPFISQMEKYAKEQNIPIMDSHTIETFLGLLSIQRPSSVLEIGSAIGYSAIRMAESLPTATITTIERNEKRYEQALNYIANSGYGNRIQIFKADALDFDMDILSGKMYDALFIDAAKGQYKRFFKKYSPMVKSGGVIYCDNMFMHGMVLQEDLDIPRRKRTMIRNLKEFTGWIMAHPDYNASLLPVGDGILIAIKKEI